MICDGITYAELDRLLLGLGFKRTKPAGSSTVYRHAGTDTLVALARHEPAGEARPADLAAVQRILDERGILDRKDFAPRVFALRERKVGSP